MGLQRWDHLTVVECQKCYAVWTYSASGNPPTQCICQHPDEDLLMRSYSASGEAKRFAYVR